MLRMKWVVAGLVAAACCSMPSAARAQIYTRPVAPTQPPATPAYIAQSTPNGQVLVPVYTPPPSRYKMFYGPTTETVGVAAATSYYLQPTPSGDRPVRSTVLVPTYGYTPGYYSGYDTVRYFRP